MPVHCDCSTFDGDGPAISRQKTVKARKQHTCCECREPIKKGEHHEVVDGLWDGTWDQYRTCAFCVKLRDQFCPHGHVFGELVESISECLGFDYTEDPETYRDAEREPAGWQLRERDEYRTQRKKAFDSIAAYIHEKKSMGIVTEWNPPPSFQSSELSPEVPSLFQRRSMYFSVHASTYTKVILPALKQYVTDYGMVGFVDNYIVEDVLDVDPPAWGTEYTVLRINYHQGVWECRNKNITPDTVVYVVGHFREPMNRQDVGAFLVN